jgi:transcriptional regulator with XRE-family HTH domain
MPRRRNYAPASDETLIGERLREIRVSRGVKQMDLAKKLGMDQSALSRYERGEMRLPSSLLAKMAKALNASADEILGLKGLRRGPVVRDQRFLKRLPAIDSLPERQKDALLTTIDGLLRSSKSS